MKAAEIVNHLRHVLGSISTRYGTCLNITNVSNVGNTVTYTYSGGKLSNNEGVIVSGLAQKHPLKILRVDADNGLCMVELKDAVHDLTEDDPAIPTVRVVGTGIAEIDGVDFELVEVPNRRTFIFSLGNVVVAEQFVEDVGYLVESYGSYFNGVFPAENVTATTFTVTVPDDITLLDDSAEMLESFCVQTKVRVTACATQERFFEAYTEQPQDSVWLAVVLGEQTISRDRNILSDGTQSRSAQDSKWMREFQIVDVYATLPAKDSLLGSDAKDLATNEIKADLLKALSSWKPNSGVSCSKGMLSPISNDTAAYNKAYYSHRYTYELPVQITKDDQYQPTGDRAFRDVDLTLEFSLEDANVSDN